MHVQAKYNENLPFFFTDHIRLQSPFLILTQGSAQWQRYIVIGVYSHGRQAVVGHVHCNCQEYRHEKLTHNDGFDRGNRTALLRINGKFIPL
jgi:hypothetical protein